jgi:hypothetical protein
VYTAIFGGSDRLVTQPHLPDVDFVCFTDDPSITSDQWTVVVEGPVFNHPTRASRFHKILPHVVLPDYEYTIWLDANMQLKSEGFATEVLTYLDDGPLALFPHPDRATVYEEADYSAQMPKFANEPNLKQAAHYRRIGFPDDIGLYACGVLARGQSNREMEVIAWPWLIENLIWSCLDQLSLPYLIWKYGISRPRLFPLNLWANRWFDIVPHLSANSAKSVSVPMDDWHEVRRARELVQGFLAASEARPSGGRMEHAVDSSRSGDDIGGMEGRDLL